MVNAEPSDNVTSCVNVYGLFGRFSKRACLHDWQIYVVDCCDDGRLGRTDGLNTGRKACDILNFVVDIASIFFFCYFRSRLHARISDSDSSLDLDDTKKVMVIASTLP